MMSPPSCQGGDPANLQPDYRQVAVKLEAENVGLIKNYQPRSKHGKENQNRSVPERERHQEHRQVRGGPGPRRSPHHRQPLRPEMVYRRCHPPESHGGGWVRGNHNPREAEAGTKTTRLCVLVSWVNHIEAQQEGAGLSQRWSSVGPIVLMALITGLTDKTSVSQRYCWSRCSFR